MGGAGHTAEVMEPFPNHRPPGGHFLEQVLDLSSSCLTSLFMLRCLLVYLSSDADENRYFLSMFLRGFRRIDTHFTTVMLNSV